MPTATRLFAFLGFAAMAFFATELYKPLLPEGTRMGMFTPLNMLVAGIAGWMVMGRLAGHGWPMALTSGLRTTAVALFYVLFIWSGIEMFDRATDMRYDGPVEALQQMVALAIAYVQLGLTDPQVPVAVVGGGILAGFLAEWASRQAQQAA
ncbi:MAG: TrgA family protein [Paracoccaceae bacterium]|jgi:hypothetical protein|nr:TrgA family protein [Paracoccaceae bacterium]